MKDFTKKKRHVIVLRTGENCVWKIHVKLPNSVVSRNICKDDEKTPRHCDLCSERAAEKSIFRQSSVRFRQRFQARRYLTQRWDRILEISRVFSANFHVVWRNFWVQRLHFSPSKQWFRSGDLTENSEIFLFSKALPFDFASAKASIASSEASKALSTSSKTLDWFLIKNQVPKSVKTTPFLKVSGEFQFHGKFRLSHELFRFQRRCPLIPQLCQKFLAEEISRNFFRFLKLRRKLPHSLQCVPILR